MKIKSRFKNTNKKIIKKLKNKYYKKCIKTTVEIYTLIDSDFEGYKNSVLSILSQAGYTWEDGKEIDINFKPKSKFIQLEINHKSKKVKLLNDPYIKVDMEIKDYKNVKTFSEIFNIPPIHNTNIWVENNEERDKILEILQNKYNIKWEDGTPATERKYYMRNEYLTIYKGKITTKNIDFANYDDIYTL